MYLEPIACIDLDDLESSADNRQIVKCINNKMFVVVLCTKSTQNHSDIVIKYKNSFENYQEADKLAKTYIDSPSQWYELILPMPWHKLNMMIE